MFRPARTPSPALRAALAALVLVSGCAGLPRIDPSGRRLLIWPEAPAPTLPSLPSFGNVDVPPVFAGQAPPVVPAPAPASAPVGVVGAAPGPVATTVQSPAKENLSITPTRLLAPVGSEVILKAGVCGHKGYLLTNRRIEWMLGQEGAGQFVRIGEQGEMDIMRLPWQRPSKHDNSYAVGYTAPYNVCLRRGTDDDSDDVQVERGEAWITLTSASEGVSYVTATAPESTNWDARRATATVYWVDAQWRLPESQYLQPGQTGTLVTTVTRQSDGAPVTGWLVRYEVTQGNTARLGYESGQVSEVETDASGRASVQVTPTDDQPGAALVRVTVVRPATGPPMPSPRLELGGGEVSVAWSPAAGSTGGGPVYDGGATPPPRETTPPPSPFEPPPRGDGGDTIGQPEPGVGPRLEVVLKRDTSGPIEVGDPIPVTITMINTGDAPAQNLSLNVEYDRGLSSPADTQGLYRLQYPSDRLVDLAPGDSNVIPLDFNAVDPGQHCYNVTVSADGAASAFERQCLDVQAPPPAAKPRLRVETALDAVRNVGDTLTYLATVYNDGPAAVEDVRVEVYHDPQLRPSRFSEGARELEGGLGWLGERIEAGRAIRFEVQYDCRVAADVARVTTYAVYGESDYEVANDVVEVLPARADAPPPAARSDVQGVISSSANPATVGQQATLDITLTNTGATDARDVEFRVRFPTQVRPTDLAGGRQSGNALEFPRIDVLRPREPYRLTIPYTALEQGLVSVALDYRVGADGPPQSTETAISIRSR